MLPPELSVRSDAPGSPSPVSGGGRRLRGDPQATEVDGEPPCGECVKVL